MGRMRVDGRWGERPQVLSAVALALGVLLLVHWSTQVARTLLLRHRWVLLAHVLDFIFGIGLLLVVLSRCQKPGVRPRVL